MLESLFNKVSSLKICNSIKRRLQHSCFPVKLQNFYKTFSYRGVSVAASDVKLVFPKEFGGKTGLTISNKYQSQPKKVFAAAKIQKQLP